MVRADGRLRELYHACHGRLVGQLFAVTGDLGAAEHAVEEAFLKALAGPRRFGRQEDPERWLAGTAVRIARRESKQLYDADEVAADEVGADDRRLVLGPKQLLLLDALRQLPVAQREVVSLHRLVGLPVEGVATTLGVSVETVRSRLDRGTAQLESALAELETVLDGESGRA